MGLQVAQVVVDCEDAAKLAAFWAEVLERPVDDGASPYFATIRGGGTPALMFLKVPEAKQGKNRLHLDLTSPDWRAEVKRVLEHLGLVVNRLIRISYGPFQLGDLKLGEVREVRGRVLRDQLGEKLTQAAGADFDAPIRDAEPKTDAPEPPPQAYHF